MLFHSVLMQMRVLLRKKVAVFTFFVLLGFVMVNFVQNMLNNKDIQYISQMFDPIKMLTLSDWSPSGYFLMEYYPLLVVFPTSCAYLSERDTGVQVYIKSKTGSFHYWYGKMIAVFFTTFLIFTIPFLIEIILSGICFSFRSNGDPSNYEYFQTIENESRYFMSALLLKNKVAYGVVMTLLFGVVSGILAVFNFSLTSLPFFKFKVFTFFPIYILFYLISWIERFFHPDYTLYYGFILRMFNLSQFNYAVYITFLLCLLGISFGILSLKAKRNNVL